jgi:hypothetical protein
MTSRTLLNGEAGDAASSMLPVVVCASGCKSFSTLKVRPRTMLGPIARAPTGPYPIV